MLYVKREEGGEIIREVFVSELVKDILGPRDGPAEILSSKENPLKEYLTGVLIPAKQYAEVTDEKESQEELIGDDVGKNEIEDTSDDIVAQTTVESPALDPQRKPSSMGISFSIEGSDVDFKVCVSWGEYEEDRTGKDISYHRKPIVKVITVPIENKSQFRLSDSKNIQLRCYMRESETNPSIKRISLFVVNENDPNDLFKTAVSDCIFQPQIRVKFGSATRLINESRRSSRDQTDSELAFLYQNRDFGARGHMCSVILKEFDPQIHDETSVKNYSEEAIHGPAFEWIDGLGSEDLNDTEKMEFSKPDIRSEFVPMYSVLSPEYDLDEIDGNKIILKAKELAEAWKPESLSRIITPILDGFERWINSNKDQMVSHKETERAIISKFSEDSKVSLLRMRKGLNLLLNDEKARLAFCVANKAMDLQHNWSREDNELVWRPFQLAYFLMTVESIFNPESADRNVCDLLWVATSGGKTEAYLGIIAFTVILRRLRGIEGDDEGTGTSVITRYTLRLLAIQQFRRTLKMVTALEYLRVLEEDSGTFGWHPADFSNMAKYLLGVVPFSVGLWVGSGVTPNRLLGNSYTFEGAISRLKSISEQSDSSEPSQVTTCPACESILSVPSEGLHPGRHVMHLPVKAHLSKIKNVISEIKENTSKVSILGLSAKENKNADFLTLKLEIEARDRLTIREVESVLEHVLNALKEHDSSIHEACTHVTRPGYYLRFYINRNNQPTEYNFEIFCPNQECPLNIQWFGASPAGSIHNRTVEEFLSDKSSFINASMRLKDIIEAFRTDARFFSDRIPIPALTVDDQIYMDPPTVLLSTADKFARPAFEPRSAAIFGNFDYHHSIYGYYREGLHNSGNGAHPSPSGSGKGLYVNVKKGDPPDLVLQDELHLIEGSLGGMVGIYETAIDHLIVEGNGHIPKYIASTATIRNAEDQVKSVFTRRVQLFPPFGNSSDDRFFVRDSELHPLEEEKPGRLYVGIAAPGRGPLTPMYRIWARLLQTGWQNRNSPEVDRFWTVTGYFNSIRELAGAVALYRQDIPSQLDVIGRDGARKLVEEQKVELSSRMNSTELPFTLKMLNQKYEPERSGAIDALFTTSMFGTGIDVSRLGLMVVNGQPKTTSSYIQSTGRIGRARGGLVLTFLRVSRPRDLSHYEYFSGYHRQLHRFVEPISAYPYAPKVMDRALGPVSVFMLRNSKYQDVPWQFDEYAGRMPEFRHSDLVNKIPGIFEKRAMKQPDRKRPPPGSTTEQTIKKIELWDQRNRISVGSGKKVKYVEYFKAEKDVVLGDAIHRRSKKVTTVYDDAPQSLREIEETTSFET